MFGTQVSFPQFVVLCFILYLLFGDPAFSYFVWKRNREDRLRAEGKLPPLPEHPLIAPFLDLHTAYMDAVEDMNKRTFNSLKLDQNRIILFEEMNHQFLQSVEQERRLIALKEVETEVVLSLGLQLIDSLIALAENTMKMAIDFRNVIIINIARQGIYDAKIFEQLEEIQITQVKLQQMSDELVQLKDQLKRDQAEIILEKDRVLRQVELIKAHTKGETDKSK